MKTKCTIAILVIGLALASTLASADHHKGGESTMSLAQRHQIEHEGERLINAFLRLFENEHSKTADLFTEDGQAFSSVGREKIREGFSTIDAQKLEANVLISSNILVTVIDENNAAGSCYVTHYQHRFADAKHEGQAESRAPNTITRWNWEFKQVDGKWMISKLATPETILVRKDLFKYMNPQPKSDSKK